MSDPLVDPISFEADRLETALKRAVRSKKYPVENLPILQAAALEICELEYSLLQNVRQVWWVPRWTRRTDPEVSE